MIAAPPNVNEENPVALFRILEISSWAAGLSADLGNRFSFAQRNGTKADAPGMGLLKEDGP